MGATLSTRRATSALVVLGAVQIVQPQVIQAQVTQSKLIQPTVIRPKVIQPQRVNHRGANSEWGDSNGDFDEGFDVIETPRYKSDRGPFSVFPSYTGPAKFPKRSERESFMRQLRQ